MVPFDKPHTITYYFSVATTCLSRIVSEILPLISQNSKRSRDLKHIVSSIMHALVLICINQHTTFKVPSFTNSKDMIGG